MAAVQSCVYKRVTFFPHLKNTIISNARMYTRRWQFLGFFVSPISSACKDNVPVWSWFMTIYITRRARCATGIEVISLTRRCLPTFQSGVMYGRALDWFGGFCMWRLSKTCRQFFPAQKPGRTMYNRSLALQVESLELMWYFYLILQAFVHLCQDFPPLLIEKSWQ